MFRLRIRYTGLKLRGAETIDEMVKETRALAKEIIKKVTTYPPVPPLSKYVRTGDLGHGASVGNSYRRGDVVGVYLGWLDDEPPYWMFVTGPLQRPYHAANGWRRLDQYLVQYERNYGQRLDQIMKRMWS